MSKSTKPARALFVPFTVRSLIERSRAPNTRKAYASDLAHFRRWGGSIPCTAQTLAKYMASCVGTYKPSTIRRRVAAISSAHSWKGLPSPALSGVVRLTWKGIVRSNQAAPRRAKPLNLKHLEAISKAMARSSEPRALRLRDWAMLTLGFCGAFRRSEIASLKLADIQWSRSGALITLGNTKTESALEAISVAIPRSRSRLCPIAALRQWMKCRGSERGVLFTVVDANGDPAIDRPIRGETVGHRLKHWLRCAAISPDQFSAHSLRAGLVTAAAIAGVPSWKIKQQTRHRTEAALAIYIRETNAWRGNAAAAVLV